SPRNKDKTISTLIFDVIFFLFSIAVVKITSIFYCSVFLRANIISRIKQCKKEVWAVKLADRITNLQPPPSHWNKLKKTGYLLEANYILKELQGANEYLENRLAEKIVEYQDYII
ncbi:hypothetical protein C0T31_12025, partial [Dysgonamonadaceae bacterium]